MTALAVGWRPLEPPRVPEAVLGEGASVAALAGRAADRLRTGAALRAATSDGVLLVVGEAQHLPWAEGVTYLGHEDGLLLPTALTPDVPVDLLGQAVRQAFAANSPAVRLAVLPGRVLAFRLDDRPTDPGWLASWASREVSA